jgi:hypothetical protein
LASTGSCLRKEIMTDSYFSAEFRIGRVLSQASSVVARNFIKFVLVGSTASLPGLLISMIPIKLPAATSQNGGMRIWSALLVIVLSSLVQSTLVHAAAQVMRGQSVNIAESMRAGLRRFFPVIGIWFAAFAAALTLGVGLVVIVERATPALPNLSGLIAVITTIGVLVLICALYVSWVAAVPACVIEQLGPWRSLRRSRELTKGHRWRLFGLLLLVLIVFILFSGILGTVLAAVTGAAIFSSSALLFGAKGAQAVNLILSGVWSACFAAIMAVTHHDLRTAKEGVSAERILPIFE